MTENLRLALDGARLVRVVGELVLVWHGGHGVHVYHPADDWREVDFGNTGDFAKDEATPEQVGAYMDLWVEEHQ